MHTVASRVLDPVLRTPSDPDGKLLERCPIWKHKLQLCVRQPLLRVTGEPHAGLPHVPESLRPDPREVDEAPKRQQRLVCRDVRGRLLAADVLFAGLQGQDIAALTRGVERLADDPSGHATREFTAGGDEPVVRAGEGLVVARALSFADRDAAAVVSWRFENTEGHRVDVRDRYCFGVVCGGGEVRGGLETAEEVRLLEDDARGVGGRVPELVRIGGAVAVRNLHDLEPEARCVRLHDLAHLRIRGFGNDHLRSARRMLRDVTRIRRDGRPVVAGRIRNVHPGQLADHGLVLEDRLQDSLAHLRLVGRIGGEQLPALQHRVHDRGNVVVVDSGAEEGDLLRGVDVARSKLLEVACQLLLRKRRLEVEPASEAYAEWKVLEEILDRCDSDRLEHRLPVGVGDREVRVRHCSATTCLYAPASSKESVSEGSLSRIRISQPSP